MKKEPKKDDVSELLPKLNSDDCKNRLAAAEYDMHKLASHVKDGYHPNLMEI